MGFLKESIALTIRAVLIYVSDICNGSCPREDQTLARLSRLAIQALAINILETSQGPKRRR
jgi:hypothetical protein